MVVFAVIHEGAFVLASLVAFAINLAIALSLLGRLSRIANASERIASHLAKIATREEK